MLIWLYLVLVGIEFFSFFCLGFIDFGVDVDVEYFIDI